MSQSIPTDDRSAPPLRHDVDDPEAEEREVASDRDRAYQSLACELERPRRIGDEILRRTLVVLRGTGP